MKHTELKRTEFDRLQELEWQAQERALREERERAGSQSTDARVAEYRLVARALRQSMPDGLPTDFARQLAARVGHVPLDTRLERWLTRLLIVAMAVSGIVAILIYGAGWWDAVASSVPQTSAPMINWICAVAACMGGSWLFEQMRSPASNANAARA